MNGFQAHDEAIARTSLQYRVLRTLLTAHLPVLHDALKEKVLTAFEAEISTYEVKADGGWFCVSFFVNHSYLNIGRISLHTFSVAKDMLRTATSFVFFGEELCQYAHFERRE